MGVCYYCGKNVDLPFRCSYCHHTFCSEHRLPENHNCLNLPKRSRKNNKPTTMKVSKIKDVEKKKTYKTHSINGKIIVLLILIVISGIIYVQYKPSLHDFQEYAYNASESIEKGLQDLKENIEGVGKEISETFEESIKSEIKLKDIEVLILNYTNLERKKHGLSELVWDDKLAEIAREHSQDMANNSFFSHINPKGEGPTDRGKRHGYSLYKDLGGGWYTEGIAENIGAMPTGNVEGMGYVSNNADSIAKAQVEAWMGSSGHRENILEPDYDKLGVGVAYDGTYYISTQNFW